MQNSIVKKVMVSGLLFTGLFLAGCATDGMEPMDGGMHKSGMKEDKSMGATMEDSMMKDSEKSMKDTMGHSMDDSMHDKM